MRHSPGVAGHQSDGTIHTGGLGIGQHCRDPTGAAAGGAGAQVNLTAVVGVRVAVAIAASSAGCNYSGEGVQEAGCRVLILQ
jgi:hypothetical protein